MANSLTFYDDTQTHSISLNIPTPTGTDVVTMPSSGTVATLESPAFTGTPTAPTPTAGDNSAKVATTAYVDGKMVLSTAVTATGTAVDFTGIPSWVKRITVMFSGVSTNGSSPIQVQLGDSGGVETTGYSSVSCNIGGTPATATATSGILCNQSSSLANTHFGLVTICNVTTNVFSASASIGQGTNPSIGSASKTLSGTLDRIRITTVNGTDTFDAGTINIMYER